MEREGRAFPLLNLITACTLTLNLSLTLYRKPNSNLTTTKPNQPSDNAS